MGITEGVVRRVHVPGADGALLDAAEVGELAKEHRLRGTVSASWRSDGERTATRTLVLTGDLDDVVRFGVGPAWAQVAGVDDDELPREPTTSTSQL